MGAATTTSTDAGRNRKGKQVRLSPCENTCSIINGSLSDRRFNKENICLVVGLNSVSCKNVGAVKDLVELYPYCNVAGIRFTKQGSRSIAQVRDRNPEGTAIINLPPIYRSNPTVASLICQFGMSSPVECNSIAQQMIKTSYDGDLKYRLRRDTTVDRIFYFEKCLRHLEKKLEKSKYSHIDYVMFPLGIGRAGRVDTVWLKRYLPLIFSFSRECVAFGMRCVLVAKKNQLKQLENVAFKNSQAKIALQKLKLLNVIDITPPNQEEKERVGVDVCGIRAIQHPTLEEGEGVRVREENEEGTHTILQEFLDECEGARMNF